MPDKESSPQESTYSKIPDETFPIEDFGVRATVKVWHSPVPKIRTTFERLNDELVNDDLATRYEKRDVLRARAIQVGFTAISSSLKSVKEHDGTEIELTISSGSNDVKAQIQDKY